MGLAFRAFEAMHPIGAVVVEEENYGADAPRERVGVIEKAQLVGVLHDERNIRNAQHQIASMTAIGTKDLPAPRRTEETACE